MVAATNADAATEPVHAHGVRRAAGSFYKSWIDRGRRQNPGQGQGYIAAGLPAVAAPNVNVAHESDDAHGVWRKRLINCGLKCALRQDTFRRRDAACPPARRHMRAPAGPQRRGIVLPPRARRGPVGRRGRLTGLVTGLKFLRRRARSYAHVSATIADACWKRQTALATSCHSQSPKIAPPKLCHTLRERVSPSASFRGEDASQMAHVVYTNGVETSHSKSLLPSAGIEKLFLNNLAVLCNSP